MKLKEERAFARTFCSMLDECDCDMSKREKRRLKLSMMFNPVVRKTVIEEMEENYKSLPVGLAMPAAMEGVEFGNIDWENFDWESAKDFWLAILEAIMQIIVIFI
jgi:hypothetical protein